MGRCFWTGTLLTVAGLALCACRTHLSPHVAAPSMAFGSGSDELDDPPAGAALPPDPGEATARAEAVPVAEAAPAAKPVAAAVAAPTPPFVLPHPSPRFVLPHPSPPSRMDCRAGLEPSPRAAYAVYPRRSTRKVNTDPLAACDPLACWRNAYWGTSLSFLPNVGLSLLAGGVFERNRVLTWSWEGELTYQFIDDETFADDGNPSAGDWWQFQAGVKAATSPMARRHWTGRTGLVWFYAGEHPNIVEEKGNYFGIYLGIGFESDITASLTMGPELSAMLVIHEDGLVEVVPQINWHFIWNF